MTRLPDIGTAQASIETAFSRESRKLETWRDVAKAEIRVYDHDYEIELGAVSEFSLLGASPREVARLVSEACREPTSLEILYYAQVGGPHVMGGVA